LAVFSGGSVDAQRQRKQQTLLWEVREGLSCLLCLVLGVHLKFLWWGGAHVKITWIFSEEEGEQRKLEVELYPAKKKQRNVQAMRNHSPQQRKRSHHGPEKQKLTHTET
jgi:hypothetical protein